MTQSNKDLSFNNNDLEVEILNWKKQLCLNSKVQPKDEFETFTDSLLAKIEFMLNKDIAIRVMQDGSFQKSLWHNLFRSIDRSLFVQSFISADLLQICFYENEACLEFNRAKVLSHDRMKLFLKNLSFYFHTKLIPTAEGFMIRVQMEEV